MSKGSKKEEVSNGEIFYSVKNEARRFSVFDFITAINNYPDILSDRLGCNSAGQRRRSHRKTHANSDAKENNDEQKAASAQFKDKSGREVCQ